MKKRFAKSPRDMRQLVPPMGGCLATDRVMVDGNEVGYVYRAADPANPMDNGWRFFAGDESQEYLDEPGHTGIYALNTVANYDPDILPYLDTPAPCAFEKIKGAHAYRRVEGPAGA